MPLTRKSFELAVVGGGPAGTSTAIAAARSGAQVVLFEAKNFPRHKVCGEFVSAESLHILRDLLRNSLAGSSLIETSPVIARTRLFLDNRMIEARVKPPAVSIARYDLDAALWRAAAEAGVTAHTNCEVTTVTGNGPFQLETSGVMCDAKAVVIAAGRWSQFTPDRIVPAGAKWIGIKGHFHEADPSKSSDLYFFDHGYCGVQPVTPDVVNACAMVRSDRATTLADVVSLHPKLAERAADWTPAARPVSTAPLVYRPPQSTRGQLIFAGDAAAFIDPFVGDGISIALRSGWAAAESLRPYLSSQGTLADCVRGYGEVYDQRFAPLFSMASRVRSLLSLPALPRALAFEVLRIPGVMPYVIRKTRHAS